MTAQGRPAIELSENELLAKNVQLFVLDRIGPSANHVRVDAEQGTVTLSGRVASFYQRQLWLNGTQRLAGVVRVIDQLKVMAHSK